MHPTPTPESRPYWDGLLSGRVMLQKCAACGTVRHYPRPVCPDCHAFDATWIEASGEARVHSWAVSHHAFHPSMKKDLPVTLVTVDLPEGVRICAPLRRAEGLKLTLGMPLRLGVERVDADLAIPVVAPH